MNRAWVKCGIMMLMLFSMLMPARTNAAPPGIDVSAAGAALIDVQSGRILYSKQGDVPMRIASLTKVMTAIIAIENGDLSSMVKVSKNAFGKEGSSLYMKLGEEMSLHNMLYGLMLRSGNDAATAIAEHIGGSVEGFAYMMNEKAAFLGMSNSHFINPSGLDDGEGHRSTAHDMAKLTAYALKNPIFQEIVKTKQKKVPNPNEAWDYVWFNKNKMLGLFEGADGVKTGYTKLAKRTLITSATRGGQQLAVVTLNDSNDWVTHARLFQYGFEHYPLQVLVEKGAPIENSDAVTALSFAYPLYKDEQGKVTRQVQLTDRNSIDYRLGDRGSLNLFLNGKTIGTIPLFAANSPKLLWPEQQTFSFKTSEPFEASSLREYLGVLRTVMIQLFSPFQSDSVK